MFYSTFLTVKVWGLHQFWVFLGFLLASHHMYVSSYSQQLPLKPLSFYITSNTKRSYSKVQLLYIFLKFERVNYQKMSLNTPFNGLVGAMQDGLGLNLELGGDYYHSSSSSSTSWSGFTLLQLQELELQNHIYKYMEAGLPIPYQLIFPIWKSVINSLGCSTTKMQQFHHTLADPGNGGWIFDLKKSMEPEPERCRRTDGKKWRCSKDVVPNHKYCEKHVHRGRPRSRKHVENSAPP